MLEVTLDQAQVRLPDLIKAAIRGETVWITADAQQTVRLVPMHRTLRRRRFGSAKGLIVIAEDFNAPHAPLPDFVEYMA